MMTHGLLVLLAVASTGVSADDAEKWWAHVRFLAADEMRGRETGSPEHRRAAEYVAAQFEANGLERGGTSGFLQEVPFLVRTVEEHAGTSALVDKVGDFIATLKAPLRERVG